MSTVTVEDQKPGDEVSDTDQSVNLMANYLTISQDHFMHRMDVERVNFAKLFSDIKLHADAGLKLRQHESSTRFYDLFDSLLFLLGPAQEYQEIILKGCSK